MVDVREEKKCRGLFQNRRNERDSLREQVLQTLSIKEEEKYNKHAKHIAAAL